MEPHDLTIAFSVWAAVVGLIGVAIVYELTRLRSEMRQISDQLNSYIVSMERRVSTIEAHMSIKHADFVAHNGG